MKGTLVSFGFAALVWEAFARSGLFPAVATPSLLAIGGALVAMIADGTLFVHVLYTLYRIVVGLTLAAIVGVPLGMLMGRFGSVERFVLPLVSVLNPIPSLAWVPVFIMWFGLGLVFERVVFQSLERRTVGRWGMVRMAGA